MQLRGGGVNAQADAALRVLAANLGPVYFEPVIGKEPLEQSLAVLGGRDAGYPAPQEARVEIPARELLFAVQGDFDGIALILKFKDADFEIGVAIRHDSPPCPSQLVLV